MAQVLIVGCGYAGERVAQLHLARGDRVFGTARDPVRVRRLLAAGVDVLQQEIDGPLVSWPRVERIYYTVPPPPFGVVDTRIRGVLTRLPPPVLFTYFSTTGVYGDQGGQRVSEEATLHPGTDRARRRVNAERQVNAWCEARSCLAVILRVPAIYGPGRLPIEKLRRGRPLAMSTAPGNRIHVDDLARAALAITDTGTAGSWNVGDGNHLSPADFADCLADMAALPRPRRLPLASSDIPDSRRVDVSKLLGVPGFRLLYPDPEAGIRASLK